MQTHILVYHVCMGSDMQIVSLLRPKEPEILVLYYFDLHSDPFLLLRDFDGSLLDLHSEVSQQSRERQTEHSHSVSRQQHLSHLFDERCEEHPS